MNHRIVIVTKNDRAHNDKYEVPGHSIQFVAMSAILEGKVSPEKFQADMIMIPKGLKGETGFRVRVWAKQTMLHKPYRERRVVMYA